MGLPELSRENFREVVGTERIVLIECWAPGCGVCARFDPVFRSVAGRHTEHVFARMNVATDEDLGEYFGVEHTPTLMLYRDGLLLLKKPGTFSEEDLEDIIRQAESLDMERVRADLESGGEEDSDEKVRES